MIDYIINLIFPKVCGICDKICKDDICNHCNKKINNIKRNKKHIYLAKNFDTHMYIFDYKDLIRNKIIRYKFQDKGYLYKTFSKIIVNDKKICGFLENYDIIIPVPISKQRKQTRGYNQTELIAKSITKSIQKLEYSSDILLKIKETIPQSKLDSKKRKQNILDAYKIKDITKVKNKKILLFDDIYTTGNTVNECSKILKQSGTKEIGVLTLAKD